MKTTKQVHRLYGSIIAFAKAAKTNKLNLNNDSHKLLLESILVCSNHFEDENLCLEQTEKLNLERLRLYPKCKNCTKKCDKHIEYIRYKLTEKEEIQKNYLFSIISTLSYYTDMLFEKRSRADLEKQMEYIYESLFYLNSKNVMENIQKNITNGLSMLNQTVYRVYV